MPVTIKSASLVLLSAFAMSCGGDSGEDSTPDPNDPLPPPAKGEGFQLAMEIEVAAATEAWKCQVSDIETSQFTQVNRAESVQSAGMHHMDILAIAFAGVDLPPGMYDCDALYDQYPELMDEGLFIYASQHENQVIQLPDGVVASLPPNLRVMQEIHYVNATDFPVSVFSKVNAYDYTGEITDSIWGTAVRDLDITIPPGAQHTEWTRCVMTDPIDLLFLTSHTHALASKVTIRPFDGTDVGDIIYENTDWQSPNLISFGDAPLHVPAGQGFEFSCDFENPTSDTVVWGFAASDEMCQIALVYTPGDGSIECEVVSSSTDTE